MNAHEITHEIKYDEPRTGVRYICKVNILSSLSLKLEPIDNNHAIYNQYIRNKEYGIIIWSTFLTYAFCHATDILQLDL